MIDNVLFLLKEAIKQREPGTEAININKLYPSLNIALRNSGYVNIRAYALGKEFATTKTTKTIPKHQTETDFNFTFETADFPQSTKTNDELHGNSLMKIQWNPKDRGKLKGQQINKR